MDRSGSRRDRCEFSRTAPCSIQNWRRDDELGASPGLVAERRRLAWWHWALLDSDKRYWGRLKARQLPPAEDATSAEITFSYTHRASGERGEIAVTVLPDGAVMTQTESADPELVEAPQYRT